ncbi:maleylpyruvate isomerase family mycothiol-dependent enzyme [Streptomyces sp. NBC_01381]|uniref:maleylpyruvate isomerase family mycothiol-dependent enzyme n=1 Tax=Streptomyces sp. NBC_01381 TaxID=2903845 RepID=UPI00225A2A85|nr:maleylpyruvate isomerase family mycothiol-dependent enzyme [Streptomyces sp. NBC_01381]MCX4669067.1 maleylpyruvate isomerase family mycothiol-dependent enzyme [Streptomyces sp. NBC_01381]
MEISQHLQILDAEGKLLAGAAETAGTDAEVATCPGWQVRDLLRHTGVVHRWAAAFVAEECGSPRPMGDPPGLDGPALVDWYRQAHADLVGTLRAASPDVQCWAFLPAPSPLAFWARRQANETTVHRVDAESALGGTPSPIGTEFAVDGIDELLRGFHARSRSQVRVEKPCRLRVRATDADASWTVRLSAEPPVTERGGTEDVDCELSGAADQLYLALWNRANFPHIDGDSALAALWQETSGV